MDALERSGSLEFGGGHPKSVDEFGVLGVKAMVLSPGLFGASCLPSPVFLSHLSSAAASLSEA